MSNKSHRVNFISESIALDVQLGPLDFLEIHVLIEYQNHFGKNLTGDGLSIPTREGARFSDRESSETVDEPEDSRGRDGWDAEFWKYYYRTDECDLGCVSHRCIAAVSQREEGGLLCFCACRSRGPFFGHKAYLVWDEVVAGWGHSLIEIRLVSRRSIENSTESHIVTSWFVHLKKNKN